MGWADRLAAAADSAGNVSEEELMREPRPSRYSRAPRLTNLEQVQRLLMRLFPKSLKRAGGEARAMVWLFINQQGEVLRSVIRETSGHAEVDSVALAASRTMRFRPAELQGRPVAVWVVQPVRLRVEEYPFR